MTVVCLILHPYKLSAKMKKISTIILIITSAVLAVNSQNINNSNTDTSLAPVEQLQLIREWDKTFPKSEKVEHRKVTFVNL